MTQLLGTAGIRRAAKAAVALTAVATLGVGTAFANGGFSDVEEGRFYEEPVAWAASNGITTGCGNGEFCPDAPVTRGQNVTFAWRYDQYIVQPALTEIGGDVAGLTDRLATAEAEVAELEAKVADLEAEVAAAAQTELVVRDGGDVYPAIVPANGETALVFIEDRWWAFAAAYGWGVREATQYFESVDCTGTRHISPDPTLHGNQVRVSGGAWHDAAPTGAVATVDVESYLGGGSCTTFSSSLTNLVPISLGDELDPPALTSPYLDVNE